MLDRAGSRVAAADVPAIAGDRPLVVKICHTVIGDSGAAQRAADGLFGGLSALPCSELTACFDHQVEMQALPASMLQDNETDGVGLFLMFSSFACHGSYRYVLLRYRYFTQLGPTRPESLVTQAR